MIETDRLIIRNFIKADVDDYFEFASDVRVGPNAGWPCHTSKKETLAHIKYNIKSKKIFAVVLKENNKVIGKIGIYPPPNISDFFMLTQNEIGISINPKFWGNGYAAEAFRGLIEYCFKKLDIDVLWYGFFIDNKRSESVVKRLNFNFYNRIIYDATDIGKKDLADMYYLTKEEYLKRCKNG